MKVLYQWLREFVPIAMPPASLAEALSAVGLAVESVVECLDGERGEFVLDLDLTSNRPDCLSHYGVAREIAALSGLRLASLTGSGVVETEPATPAALALRVEVDAPAACGRYCALVFEGAAIADSPEPIAARLRALGHRAINNIADLTNYTLWEMGHPTHAFDLDKLSGAEIRVRFARPGETLVTLDGVDRNLDPADLVIADAVRPVALAGVMGGLETAISAATRRVALESAWFDPLTVRRAAKRHGLHTDASHRFERGADPEAAAVAAQRIAARARAQGFKVRPGMIEVRAPAPDRPLIPLRPAALERILGVALPIDEAQGILQRLGLQPHSGAWKAPSWRHDLAREIDLIEEVARVHGLDRIPARLPAFAGVAAPLPEAELRDRVRRQLRAHGYAEAVTLAFAGEAECQPFAGEAQPVRVLNPLNEEQGILRSSSLPAMLHLLRNNLHRGVENPRLYEFGKLYRHVAGNLDETPVLTLGAQGARSRPHWAEAAAAMAFDDLKGEVAAVLDHFELPALAYGAPPPHLHPRRGATLTVDGAVIGSLGQLYPALASAWKFADEVWVAEIQLARLYAAGARAVRYHAPSRFPASDRDFSFLFPATVTWAMVDAALCRPPIANVTQWRPAEIFRGAQLGDGRYSLLLRVRFQHQERTLREEEVQSSSEQIAVRLTQLGGEQRR